MGLPQIATPKYEITLPVSKKVVSFRPFLVKEEKILLIAIEEESQEKISVAVKNILNSCTFGLVEIDELPQADAEYLFIKCRNKSMGEGVEAVSTCVHCEKKNFMTLNFDNIIPSFPLTEIKNPIQLDEQTWVKMRYPTIDLAYEMDSATDADGVTKVISKCIESIIAGDSVIPPTSFTAEELAFWVDEMTEENYKKLSDFVTNAPKLKFEQKYECVHCRKENLISMEGLSDFFD